MTFLRFVLIDGSSFTRQGYVHFLPMMPALGPLIRTGAGWLAQGRE